MRIPKGDTMSVNSGKVTLYYSKYLPLWTVTQLAQMNGNGS